MPKSSTLELSLAVHMAKHGQHDVKRQLPAPIGASQQLHPQHPSPCLKVPTVVVIVQYLLGFSFPMLDGYDFSGFEDFMMMQNTRQMGSRVARA